MTELDAQYLIFCAERMEKEKQSTQFGFWFDCLKEHVFFLSQKTSSMEVQPNLSNEEEFVKW